MSATSFLRRLFGRTNGEIGHQTQHLVSLCESLLSERGEITGNVRATERIDLKRTARMYGDVEAPVVVVEEGVVFEGHCRMAKPSPMGEISGRDLAVVPLKR